MATPALPSVPSRPGEASAGMPSAMTGEQPKQERADSEQRNRAFVGQVKQLHSQLDDLARQYPAFASYARRAQEAMKDGMVRTLAEMDQPGESGGSPATE